MEERQKRGMGPAAGRSAAAGPGRRRQGGGREARPACVQPPRRCQQLKNGPTCTTHRWPAAARRTGARGRRWTSSLWLCGGGCCKRGGVACKQGIGCRVVCLEIAAAFMRRGAAPSSPCSSGSFLGSYPHLGLLCGAQQSPGMRPRSPAVRRCRGRQPPPAVVRRRRTAATGKGHTRAALRCGLKPAWSAVAFQWLLWP